MQSVKTDKQQLDDAPPRQAGPRTITVLGLLVVAAAALSYLGAFAMTDALAKAEIIAPVRRHPDPRYRWMLYGFVALLVLFSAIGGVMRYFSRRQLGDIDSIANAEGKEWRIEE